MTPDDSATPAVVICGTGTDVGKTWLTCDLVRRLRAAGANVSVRKPAQSFDPDDSTTDARELAEAAASQPEVVCPRHRWYEIAMAPPMAADVLGRPEIVLTDLVEELTWPSETELVLVETAGGVRSPIAHDGDTRDLLSALDERGADVVHVVLVAHAGLGTLNEVLLSVDALRVERRSGAKPWPITVFLNRFDPTDPLPVRNCSWLVDRHGLDVVVDPDVLADRLRRLCRAPT